MNCHICGYNIPEGKKYCPGCGRVVRQNAQNQPQVSSDTMKFERPITGKPGANTPRAAAPTQKTPTQKTINIPDIFSTDPNAPEYTDPHAYDTATAHVLEYDRMFVSKSDDSKAPAKQSAKAYTDDRTKQFPAVQSSLSKKIIIEQEPEDDYYYDDNNNYDEEQTSAKRDRKAGPHINVKALIIIVAVILGISLSVKGVYEIGKTFGFWGTEVSSSNAEDDTDREKLPANKEPDSEKEDKDDKEDKDTTEYKTGVYTVKSEYKNIFVYKSVTDRRITATIPRGAILEITQIEDGLGKTTYNAFTGWVEMTDLNYTPDATPDNKEPETTTKPEETSVKKDEEDKEDEETPAAPTSPGTYTVTLTGGSPLNVRDAHSPDGEVIGTLKNGTTVEVIEVKSGWGKITLDGKEGWVYMQYLK